MIETDRLYIRELEFSDDKDLFELDSDPEVHTFLEQNPVKDISEITEVIKMLKKQYEENGIARWAVVDKKTNECVGWSGLKFFRDSFNNHTNFYELGYRIKRKHWGKGFATESSEAILKFGFDKLGVDKFYAYTDPKNLNSKKVLTKLGFEFIESFKDDNDVLDWFELKKSNFEKIKPSGNSTYATTGESTRTC